MKQVVILVTLIGLVIGGITVLSRDVKYEAPIQAQEIIEQEQPVEPTAEELLYAEKLKIKEQEARLEAKRDIQIQELDAKSIEYSAHIAELQKEYDTYVAQKEAEIKETEAELASFIKATSLSKNE